MKNLYKILTFVFVFLTFSIGEKLKAQCTIAVTQSTSNVCAGSPVTLKARLVNINAGTGANGSITVSSTYHTDSIRSAVSGNNASGTNTITVASSTGFAVGQEVLIITMADPATTGNLVGQYEFGTIASISSNTLTLTQNKVNTYNASATVKHQVIRVPQYQNVTVGSGGSLTCNAWNGTTGGVLAFRSTGTVTINTGGTITAAGLGYRGVANITSKLNNRNGGQGEGIYGQGLAGAASSGANGTFNNANGNGGGGGTGTGDAGGGAGGGHAAVGSNGIASGGHAGGTGGALVGTSALARFYLGGAGGEGGSDEDGGTPGKGGNGGGIIFISAVSVVGNGTITAAGEAGGNGTNNFGGSGCGMAGGGGGAGGSIHIQSTSFTGNGSNIIATGGNGGVTNGCGGPGGAGSVGRIRFDINGTLPVTNPAAFQGTFPAITGTSTFTWSTSSTIDSIIVNPTTTTTYSVTGVNTNAGCSTSTNYQLVVTPLPVNPITTNGSRCSSGPVTLSASSTTPGTTIRWYTSPTGGTSIGSGNTFNTPSISSTTTFYAEAVYQSLPGDTLASARMLIGLRKLRSSYNGNAIKLRRSTDNTTQIFGFSGNELDTVAIKTWLGAGIGYVEIIYDQSGFGNNMTQTSTSNQPTIVFSGWNGYPVLRFTTNQFMTNTTNFPAPFSSIGVARLTGTSNQRVFSSVYNNWLLGYHNPGRQNFHFDGWVAANNITTNLTVPYINTGVGTGSLSAVYENGMLLASNAGGLTGPNGVQFNGYGGGINQTSAVDIFEYYVCNTTIDSMSRRIVESNIANRFSLSVPVVISAAIGCNSASRTAAVATISTNAFSLPDSLFACGDSILVSADTGYTTYSWNGGGATRTKWIKTAGWATCTVTGGPCGGTQADSVFVNLITNKIVQNDTTICAGSGITLSTTGNSFSGSTRNNILKSTASSGTAVITEYSAAGGASNYAGSIGTSCSDSWTAFGTLCDEGVAQNSPDSSFRSNTHAGATWSNASGGYGRLVIDLGSVKTFNAMSVFQMFSDGKTSHISLFYHSNTGASAPSSTASGWTQIVNQADIGAGTLNGNFVTNPYKTTFPNVTARYVMIYAYNTGIYGSGSYIELRSVKLFASGVSTGNSNVRWSNGDTNSTITVTPSTSTTYYCTSTLNGRACIDSVRITVNPKPVPTITPSGTASICSGDSLTLSTITGTGLTYQWLRNGAVIAGATSSTFKTTTAASYRVVVTNATGCRDTSATTVASVATKPTATATAASATTFCNGGSVVINANTGTGLTYQWLRNNTVIASATNASYTADTTGSYRVLVSNASGCKDTSTVVAVTENAIPTITSSTPASRCGTGTVALTAAASAGTINWYAAATGGTSLATGTSFTTPSISATTTYYVDATANGCTTATRTAVAATVNAIPTITSSTPESRCGTGTVALTVAASAGTINWYAAATGGTSLATGTSFTTPSIATTTTYYVDATANGCTTATRTAVAATVNTLPTATATAAGSTTLCTGGSVVINANTGTGLTYQWLNNNAPIASATNAAYTANAAGSYRVLVTNANSCKDTSTALAVVVNAIPTITSSTPASRCGTGTVALTAAASAGTINWYAAATGGTSLATGTSFTTPSISATTTYYVDATANGCTTATRTAVAATVNALPTATATAAGSTSLCTGGSVVINANTGTGLTYQWLNNNAPIASATNAAYTANAAGSYRVLVTNANSCKDTSTAVAVVVNTIPTITSSTPASRCGTGTVALTAAASAGTINWYANSTGGTSLATGTSFTTPSISATTTYYVDATANGCTTATRTAVAATVNPNLTASVSISSNTTSICGSAPITFTATPTNGGTTPNYQWKKNGVNVGTNSDTYVLNNALNADSVYVVMTSNATPCLVNTTANSNGIKLTSSTVTPTVAVTANPGNIICNGTSVTFTANATNGGSTPAYQWKRNGVNVGTNASTFVTSLLSTNDSISVVLTSNASCLSTSTATSLPVVMTVNAIPTITSSTPASRCGTGTVALTAAASAGTINWYSAATGGTSLATGTSFTTPSISATTTYYVDATANGCTTATRTAVAATVNVLPTATATAAGSTTLCTGGSVVINANTGTGLTYQWLNNNAPIASATNAAYTANAAGSYRVLVTNANSCKDTSTAVAVVVNATPSIVGVTPASRCGTGTLNLGAAASAGTINWYAAATGGTSLATGTTYTTPSISATTTYYVDATANGCTTASRTSIAATVNAKPLTSAISGRTTVHSDTVETYAVTNTTGSSYVWTVIGGAKLTGGTTNSITVDWDVAYTAGMVKVVETNTLGCQGDTVFKPIVSIVPVEFLSFDAKRINDKVNLTWVTASEINNSHFEVERSIDNNKFENIGTVKGNGTTSMMNTYKLTDNISKLMNSNATTLYYRLKQVDFDGEFAYTDVRTVELNKLDAASAALSPNPFTDHFNVTINEPKATSAMIQVMDANGKQVRTLSIELNAGTTQYELGQLGDLSSGMYFVQIITASGNSYTIKAIRR